MTITQLIQSSPAKVLELFAKLADTTDGAVKTREKLFADLKAELELHARLEEEHLFPALRKHKETKDLVAEALDDNKQARALLAELEKMPKEGEAFPGKLAELKKVFQQHVRDEKKELLPAVRKALSDEQAQAITEKIEAEKAAVEDARRADAEKRRTEMRREREDAERREAEAKEHRAREAAAELERSAKSMQAESMREEGSRMAEAGGAAAEAALDVAARSARTATGLTGQTAQQATQGLGALMQSGTVLASGFQDVSREWLSFTQDLTRRNLEGFGALLRCRSPQDLIATQSELLRDNLQELVSNGLRISQLSTQVASEAMRTMHARGKEHAGRDQRRT